MPRVESGTHLPHAHPEAVHVGRRVSRPRRRVSRSRPIARLVDRRSQDLGREVGQRASAREVCRRMPQQLRRAKIAELDLLSLDEHIQRFEVSVE